MLAATLVAYVVITYALAFVIKGKVKDTEDFLVAGRRLPLSLAWATLLATWFGAGTVLTAADEVRAEGLRVTALEPLGAGFCLILAGLFFAARLWNMRLLTIADFFRRRFGPRAEIWSAVVMVPGYFGWIAVQFICLAGMLQLAFGLDPTVGIFIVAVVGMGYTVLGGMWSVTLTDALQVALLLIGLVLLGYNVLEQLGNGAPGAGLERLGNEVPADLLTLIPGGAAFVDWLGVFLIAALGNLPGQDLMQRVFASKSAKVARQACILAGVIYIGFGAIPVVMGLAARVLFPDQLETAILPALAQAFLSPGVAVVFFVALVSAIISTIDSAILSPASVMAQNIFPRVVGERFTAMQLNHFSVVLVTVVSLVVALIGEDAYSLLESAYSIGLVGLFVPLVMGLYRPPRRELPALAAMGVGMGLWLVHLVAGWEKFLEPVLAQVLALPNELPIVGIAFVVYLACDRGPAPAVARDGVASGVDVAAARIAEPVD